MGRRNYVDAIIAIPVPGMHTMAGALEKIRDTPLL
jgi:hypothetical protein